jgi:hypothetical protein
MDKAPARPPGLISVVRESFTQSEFQLKGAAATHVRGAALACSRRVDLTEECANRDLRVGALAHIFR